MNQLIHSFAEVSSITNSINYAGAHELPTDVLLSKLGNMLSKEPLSDAESSDEEAEYVEYIYKPRSYFMASLCNVSWH